MKEKNYLLNTLLAAVVGLALLAALVWKTFLPAAVLPRLDLPALMALSLAALVLDHYLVPGARRAWPAVALLSAATFGLLPWAAGLAGIAQAGLLALAGGVVFTVLTWLFGFAAGRMTSGPAGKAAPLVTALGLFLAGQCFAGILL